ncbi:MAG: MerR family transcriptional regulator [Clostridia bacterium]|nr:MerR family transcriptional regulator [Clostridia bacterium]
MIFLKIKEVIEKTGLTDRAIRLYIDEGLVLPNIEESYSGRKSIDFSAEDVSRLNNIALLRKAGFSIADIKSIAEDKDSAKKIIEAFIEQTEQNIRHDTEVVEKLKSISSDEDITLETICESLSETVIENEVPQEDMKPRSASETLRKTAFGVGIFMSVLSVLAMIAYVVIQKIAFVHLNFDDDFIRGFFFGNCGVIVILFLSLTLVWLNRKEEHRKKRQKVKKIICSILLVAFVPLSIFSFLASLGGMLLFGNSLTYDIEDYLVLDSWIQEDYGAEIDAVFPDEVPQSALDAPGREFDLGVPLTTKYYYKHTFVLDPDFDLVAEWILPEEEYIKAKEEIQKPVLHTEEKGDWVCLYYEDTQEYEDWENEYYWFLIFAYNDKTRRVRYIASYAIDSFTEGPYYLSLDW